MAQTTFYAARADEIDVLRFVFAETDCHVYEAYSRNDRELRRFCSVDEVRSAFEVGSDRPQQRGFVLLDLWSPTTGGAVTVIRRELELRDATFRYETAGWGLFGLQLGGSGDGLVRSSWFAHNTEKRAHRFSDAYVQLAPPDAWDWDAVTRIGRRIMYHLRNRLAVANVDPAVVLLQADRLRRAGWTLH